MRCTLTKTPPSICNSTCLQVNEEQIFPIFYLSSAPAMHQQSLQHLAGVIPPLLSPSLQGFSLYAQLEHHTHTHTHTPPIGWVTQWPLFSPIPVRMTAIIACVPSPGCQPPCVEMWAPYHCPWSVALGSDFASDNFITLGNGGGLCLQSDLSQWFILCWLNCVFMEINTD